MNFLKQILATIIGVVVSGLFLFFGLIFMIGVIVQQSSDDSSKMAPSNSVLLITLDYSVVEKSELNPFGDLDLPIYGSSKTIGLNDILSRIDAAKTDNLS